MAIEIGFSSGGDRDAVILPPREHPCKLVDVRVVPNKFKTTDTDPDTQLQWMWEGLQFKSPEGKAGVITLWTGFFYGSAKAKLTALYNGIFGRSLTEAEARSIDPEKLVNVIKGFVMVLPHTKGDGTMTSKFGGFRLPDNAATPEPKQFFRDTAPAVSPVPAGGGSAFGPVGADDGMDTSDLTDPFAD